MWTIIFFTSWQCSSFVMGNDDWQSDLSDESQAKCEKSPPKLSKNEILIFILCSTSDDWPSYPRDKNQPKCRKRPPKSSKTEMLIFGYHSTSDDQPSDESRSKCKKMKCCFSEGLLLFQSGSSVYPPSPDGKVGIRVAEKFWFFRFMFNKFQPRNNSVHLFFTSWQCSSFVMGNVPIGSPYTFTICGIHVRTNLST